MASPEFDLAIVGAGPAGMAAGLTAGSEGVKTLLLEADDRYGGQARQSTRIENYPGFAQGVVGEDLASEMIDQNRKFGVAVQGMTQIVEVADGGSEGMVLIDDNGATFHSGAVILGPGVQYRRLDPSTEVDGLLGRGVEYGSPAVSDDFKDKELYVVGAGNSAGQAARYLAENCEGCNVHMLVRGDSIRKSMSPYLIEQVEGLENLSIHTGTQVSKVDGTGQLESITLRQGDREENFTADQLYLLIGANPRVNWLRNLVELDDHDFIYTGRTLSDEGREEFADNTGRQPFAYETSQPGVFAVGDIRSGSTKRVGSAGGQGIVVVGQVRDYLELQRSKTAAAASKIVA